MKNKLTEHFFYKQKEIVVENRLRKAKENMDPQLYKTFCDTVSEVFEKWELLYKAALQSPEAFTKLNRQCEDSEEGFKQLEKSINSDCSDELKRNYVEASKFIRYADQLYPQECQFSTRIELLAASIAVFVDKAVEKKINIENINENWKRNYSFHNSPHHKSFREPPLSKKLKKSHEKEQSKSISSSIPH